MIHVDEVAFHRSHLGSSYTVWGSTLCGPVDELVLWEAKHAAQGWAGPPFTFHKLIQVTKELEVYPERL